MTPQSFLRYAIRPALELLPPKMSSPEAEAMILAACLQESRLEHRFQVGGPARGFGQFELGGGIHAVMTNAVTREHAVVLCDELCVVTSLASVYRAIAYNDILCAGFSRLLLWADPHPLPLRGDADGSWACYLRTWNPGKPHPQTWPGFYRLAWEVVAGPEIETEVA